MNAVIVLHGLFLLVCYQDQTCYIVVPHTRMTLGGKDVHEYQYGTVDTTTAHKLVMNSLDDQVDLTKRMQLGNELKARRDHPFHGTPCSNSPYQACEFTLDKKKLRLAKSLDKEHVKNMISIPRPDRILGANRVLVEADDLVNNDSLQTGLVLSPQLGGLYLFSETTILVFDQGKPFTFKDEKGGPLTKGTSAQAGNTSIMVLTSWPKTGPGPTADAAAMDHSAGINGALQDSHKKPPSFNFTTIPSGHGFRVGSERAVAKLGLPDSVTALPPSPLETAGASVEPTIIKTGCGGVSIEASGAGRPVASGVAR